MADRSTSRTRDRASRAAGDRESNRRSTRERGARAPSADRPSRVRDPTPDRSRPTNDDDENDIPEIPDQDNEAESGVGLGDQSNEAGGDAGASRRASRRPPRGERASRRQQSSTPADDEPESNQRNRDSLRRSQRPGAPAAGGGGRDAPRRQRRDRGDRDRDQQQEQDQEQPEDQQPNAQKRRSQNLNRTRGTEEGRGLLEDNTSENENENGDGDEDVERDNMPLIVFPKLERMTEEDLLAHDLPYVMKVSRKGSTPLQRLQNDLTEQHQQLSKLKDYYSNLHQQQQLVKQRAAPSPSNNASVASQPTGPYFELMCKKISKLLAECEKKERQVRIEMETAGSVREAEAPGAGEQVLKSKTSKRDSALSKLEEGLYEFPPPSLAIHSSQTLDARSFFFQRQFLADKFEWTLGHSTIQSEKVETVAKRKSAKPKSEPTEEGEDENDERDTQGGHEDCVCGRPHYFTFDDDLVLCSEPRKETFHRPPIFFEELSPAARIVRTIPTAPTRHTTASPGRSYQLNIRINGVTLSGHPLTTIEHTCSAELSQLYGDYVKRREKMLMEYYSQKLTTLQSSLRQLVRSLSLTPLPSSLSSMRNNRGGGGVGAEGSGKDSATRSRSPAGFGSVGLPSPSASASAIGDQNDLIGGGAGPIKELEIQRRIRMSIADIRNTRALLEKEEKEQSELVSRIFVLWKQIKEVRKENSGDDTTNGALNPSTEIEMKFKRIQTDSEEDQRQLDFAIQSELEEEELDLFIEHKLAADETKKKAELTKKALNTFGRKFARQASSDVADSISTPPPEFDRDQWSARITQRVLDHRRAPGKPIFVPFMTRSNGSVGDNKLSLMEQRRRRECEDFGYHVRLLVNGKAVGRTKTQKLGHNLSLTFGDLFSVRLIRWPESVQLQFWQSGLIDKMIATTEIKVPGSDPEDQMDELSENTTFDGTDSFVASYYISNDPSTIPTHTCGHFSTHLQWAKPTLPFLMDQQDGDMNGGDEREGLMSSAAGKQGGLNGHIPPVPQVITKSVSNISALSLRELFSNQSKDHSAISFDPNDPTNSGVLVALQGIDLSEISQSFGLFIARPDQDILLTRGEPLRDSKRLFVLKKRNEEIRKSQQQKYLQSSDSSKKGKRSKQDLKTAMVPLSDSQPDWLIKMANSIPTDGKSPESQLILSPKSSKKPKLDATKNQKTNKKNSRADRMANLRRKPAAKTSHYVIEPELPDLSKLFLFFKGFFEISRPLKPRRMERVFEATEVTSCRILLHILRLHDVPLRDFETTQFVPSHFGGASGRFGGGGAGGNRGSSMIGEQQREDDHMNNEMDMIADADDIRENGKDPVTPFVRATFQDQEQRTDISHGRMPQFNETLYLEFNPPSNKSKNDGGGDSSGGEEENEEEKERAADLWSPESLKTCQDEIRIDVFDEVRMDNRKDMRQKDVIEQRIERRWLGYFTFPFSTLYQYGKVEGTFNLQCPLVTFAYQHSPQSSHQQDSKKQVQMNGPTQITIFAALEPPLPLPNKPEEETASAEVQDVYEYALKWISSLKKDLVCHSRYNRALAIDTQGRATLITRYIRPLKLPDLFENQSEHVAARFVSLIPLERDPVSTTTHTQLWNNSQEVLDACQGNAEEHAVLLCNYFLGLKKSAWVILGRSSRTGPSAFVLTNHNGNYWIWDPLSGEQFNARDSQCPLVEIGCVFDDRNIYANIQNESLPSMVKFDFKNTWNWRAFFGRSFKQRGLESVQPQELDYFQMSRDDSQALEIFVETQLHECVRRWRSENRLMTKFNSAVSKVLKDSLSVFEQNHQGLSPLTQDSLLENFRSVSSAHDIFGFPLCFNLSSAGVGVQKDGEDIGPGSLSESEQSIVEKLLTQAFEDIRTTEVHMNQDRNAMLATAVLVEPFVNNVRSLWVYLISMVPKKSL